MTYLIRTKKIPTVGQVALVETPEDMAAFVAPTYRADTTIRIYLFNLGTSAVPAPLAVTRAYDPEDDNQIVWLVQTLGGLSLFEFRFPFDPNPPVVDPGE